MNGYRPLTPRVRTLLEKSGLGRAERRNPARMREKLERALDRAQEAGVIGEWDWAGDGSEPDMDAPAELASLADAAGSWRDRSLVIGWPPALAAREQAIQDARERRRSGRQRGSRRRTRRL